MAKKPYISLARDTSKRPIRGQPAGDLITGNCEVVGCGFELRRGDSFRASAVDQLICEACYMSGAELPLITVTPVRRRAGTRAARGGRPTKKAQISALRAARTAQLIAEITQ